MTLTPNPYYPPSSNVCKGYSLGMDLPYLVLYFALNSGLDITREGFPFSGHT